MGPRKKEEEAAPFSTVPESGNTQRESATLFSLDLVFPLLAYRENFISELRSFFDTLQLLRIVLYAKVRRQTPQTRIMVGFWEFFEGQTELYVRFESTVRWIYCEVVWVPIQTSE